MTDEKIVVTVFAVASLVGLLIISNRRVDIRQRRRTLLPAHCVVDDQVEHGEQHSSCEENRKSRSEPIKFFHQVAKHDSRLVGGKGANLGELTQAGFPVPNGFCVTKMAFDAHMQGAKANGKTLFELIERDSTMSSASARGLVVGHAMDSEIQTAIRMAYRRLAREAGSEHVLVAVRSSATAEDSSEASFAGQLETFLGIQGEAAVLAAVKDCWASLYSDRVDSYRSMMGMARGTKVSSISVCVVVQRMLNCETAGVMFTANPFTHNTTETVITGNWGIGESVVADLVTPDTWVLDSNELTIKSETIAEKKKKVILGPPGRASQIVDIHDRHEQISPCLSHERLRDLVTLARKVESHYKSSPQDIEWGIEQGRLYLLQTRPITTLSDETPRTIDEFDTPCRSEDWITTCNAQEMFPGAMTPLTMSTFGRIADQGVQRMQQMFGCRQSISMTDCVTANYSGSFFLNMSNTLAPMCSGMIGSQMAKDNGEMSILGCLNPNEPLERLVELGGGRRWLFQRLWNGARYVKTMLFAYQRIPVMRRRIKFCSSILSYDKQHNIAAHRIWRDVDSLMDCYDDQWTDGIVTSSTSAATMLFAIKLLTERGGDVWGSEPVGELAILLGESSSRGLAESTGPVEAIAVLRERILLRPEGDARKFINSTPAAALEWLKQDGEFGRIFTSLVENHGHRCIREAEMRERDWFEDPLPLVKTLQSGVKSGLLSQGKKDHKTAKRSGEDIIRSKAHLNLITRMLLRMMISVTRGNVHLRELGKSLQVKLNSIFKHAYRKLSKALVAEGRLPDEDLIYFLTHQEVGELSCCALDNNHILHRLKVRATQRRRLLGRQSQLRFPELSQGKPVAIDLTIPHAGDQSQHRFQGTPVSAGLVRGKARVARTLDEAEALEEGEILITPQTDVGWTPFFSIAGGLVTEIGGMLSHGAVVAREYSLPCIVGVAHACSHIETGTLLDLDGDLGVLHVVIKKVEVCNDPQ